MIFIMFWRRDNNSGECREIRERRVERSAEIVERKGKSKNRRSYLQNSLSNVPRCTLSALRSMRSAPC